ncbi:MAG TPA: glycosyltransferase family 2 protein [Planctomycetota bacterium]|nr:glycosyltransferase family 2 protein [Planctomycetota bacterium]
MRRVVAVVLNWNGGARNLDCLTSLLASGGGDLEVLFVDNGSTDGSPEAVARAFPAVRQIRNGANLGFCEGNNAGLREALAGGAEFVLLLNNDVVVERGFLDPLLEAAAREARAGALGPKMLRADAPGTVWAAGGRLALRENGTRLLGHGRPDDGSFDAPSAVDFIPGCALLLRSQALRDVGLLDPSYFAYVEDVELCARLRRAGWKVLYVPGSRIRHEASASTGGGYTAARKYAMALNGVRFLRGHGGARAWASWILFDVLSLPLAAAREALRRGGNPRAVGAKARGLLDGLLGRRVTAGALERYRRSASS